MSVPEFCISCGRDGAFWDAGLGRWMCPASCGATEDDCKCPQDDLAVAIEAGRDD